MKSAVKSHISLKKFERQSNEQLIQALLDWDEQQYCQFKYDMGLRYAHYQTGGDEIGFEVLIKTNYYWAYWKNEWSKRDSEFIEKYAHYTNKAALYDEYLFANSFNLTSGKKGELMSSMYVNVIGMAMKEYVKTHPVR